MSDAILREVVLPAAFNKNGTKFVDCEFDKKYEAQDNFQSSVSFLTATVKKEEDTTKLHVVVKLQPKDENIRDGLHTDIQFYNEIFMYSELLPTINKFTIVEDTFPIFYYGVCTMDIPDKDVIVIEDLRPKGFRLSDEKGFLDLPHLELAMEKLGRFHALSYIAKKESPNEFYRLVGKLKEPSWLDPLSDWMVHTIQSCFHRAMDPLVASGRHASVLRRILARVDDKGGLIRLMRDLVAAEEPLAVLCHGDFCRNNMLFRYTSDAPVDVRFFDLATARYSSPAIDIAFFLMMNSSAAMRAANWDLLLSRYHTALSSTVAAQSRDITVPSLQQLQQELRLKAVYGFVHASFFLPIMLWGHTIDDMENAPQDITPEEIGSFNASIGGEEGTKLMMDLAKELVVGGFLTLDHPFLKGGE